MTIFDELRDEFCERNLVLYLFLGLISLAGRSETFLKPTAAAPAEDGPFLHALLGVVALRQALMSALVSFRAERAPASSSAGESNLEGLLR